MIVEFFFHASEKLDLGPNSLNVKEYLKTKLWLVNISSCREIRNDDNSMTVSIESNFFDVLRKLSASSKPEIQMNLQLEKLKEENEILKLKLNNSLKMPSEEVASYTDQIIQLTKNIEKLDNLKTVNEDLINSLKSKIAEQENVIKEFNLMSNSKNELYDMIKSKTSIKISDNSQSVEKLEAMENYLKKREQEYQENEGITQEKVSQLTLKYMQLEEEYHKFKEDNKDLLINAQKYEEATDQLNKEKENYKKYIKIIEDKNASISKLDDTTLKLVQRLKSKKEKQKKIVKIVTELKEKLSQEEKKTLDLISKLACETKEKQEEISKLLFERDKVTNYLEKINSGKDFVDLIETRKKNKCLYETIENMKNIIQNLKKQNEDLKKLKKTGKNEKNEKNGKEFIAEKDIFLVPKQDLKLNQNSLNNNLEIRNVVQPIISQSFIGNIHSKDFKNNTSEHDYEQSQNNEQSNSSFLIEKEKNDSILDLENLDNNLGGNRGSSKIPNSVSFIVPNQGNSNCLKEVATNMNEKLESKEKINNEEKLEKNYKPILFDLPVPSTSNLQYYIKHLNLNLNLNMNFNSSDNIPEKNDTSQNSQNNSQNNLIKEKSNDTNSDIKANIAGKQNSEVNPETEKIFEVIKNHQLRIMLLENEKNIKLKEMNKKYSNMETETDFKYGQFFFMKETYLKEMKSEILPIININIKEFTNEFENENKNRNKNKYNCSKKIVETKYCEIIFESNNPFEKVSNINNNSKSLELINYKDIINLLKNSEECLQNDLSNLSKKKQFINDIILKRNKAIESEDKLKFLNDLFSQLFPSKAKTVVNITNSNIGNYYNLGKEIVEKKQLKYVEYDQSEKAIKKLVKNLRKVISQLEEPKNQNKNTNLDKSFGNNIGSKH